MSIRRGNTANSQISGESPNDRLAGNSNEDAEDQGLFSAKGGQHRELMSTSMKNRPKKQSGGAKARPVD